MSPTPLPVAHTMRLIIYNISSLHEHQLRLHLRVSLHHLYINKSLNKFLAVRLDGRPRDTEFELHLRPGGVTRATPL